MEKEIIEEKSHPLKKNNIYLKILIIFILFLNRIS